MEVTSVKAFAEASVEHTMSDFYFIIFFHESFRGSFFGSNFRESLEASMQAFMNFHLKCRLCRWPIQGYLGLLLLLHYGRVLGGAIDASAVVYLVLDTIMKMMMAAIVVNDDDDDHDDHDWVMIKLMMVR